MVQPLQGAHAPLPPSAIYLGVPRVEPVAVASPPSITPSCWRRVVPPTRVVRRVKLRRAPAGHACRGWILGEGLLHLQGVGRASVSRPSRMHTCLCGLVGGRLSLPKTSDVMQQFLLRRSDVSQVRKQRPHHHQGELFGDTAEIPITVWPKAEPNCSRPPAHTRNSQASPSNTPPTAIMAQTSGTVAGTGPKLKLWLLPAINGHTTFTRVHSARG